MVKNGSFSEISSWTPPDARFSSSAATVALTSNSYFRDDSDYRIAEGIADGIIEGLSKL